MNNIKNIHQHVGNCDYQQKIKDIPEADMVSTSEEITDYSPSLNMTQTTFKKPSARKSLHLLTNRFDVKNRTSIRCVGAAKSKRRAIKDGCGLCKN